MGLFSSSYKTSVATSVSRVIEDARLPKSTKTGIIKGVIKDDSISDYLMEELVHGIGVRADRMYDYGRTKYTYGLPAKSMATPLDGQAIVTGVVASLAGHPITVEYYRYGPLNHIHLGWYTLINAYGYSQETNQLATLSAQKGCPVYLKNMVSVVKDATLAEIRNGSLDFWGSSPNDGVTPERTKAPIGRTPSALQVDATLSGDHVRVEYVWEATITVLVEGVSIERKQVNEEGFLIPVPLALVAEEYYHLKYTSNNEAKYFLYKSGSGTYPTIDEIFLHRYDGFGSFFPFVHFRNDKVSMDAYTGTPAYDTSKALIKLIGVDYQTIIDGVNSNPGIGDIQNAMMMMAVPAVSTNPLEQAYLFKFFDAAYGSHWAGQLEGQLAYAAANPLQMFFGGLFNLSRQTNISLVIQDPLFKMVLGANVVTKKTVAGVIGEMGTYSSSEGTVAYTYTVTEEVYQNDALVSVTSEVTDMVPAHTYRHQVTEVLYEEIVILGLQMSYTVEGNYMTVGTKTDPTLLIPIDFSLTDEFSLIDREVLYGRSLHYVFTSLHVTEVKWYQQGWFADLLMIAAIVITIWSMGADGGALITAVLAGNFATAAMLAVIIALDLLVAAAIGAAIQLFVQLVGVDVAVIAMIVAAAYGGFLAFQAGGLQGAPWAKELLSLSTGLSKAIGTTLQHNFKDLQKEADLFGINAAAKEIELTKAEKLLESDSVMSPFVIFGESPQDFFSRTVHSGNIGIVGIIAVSSFVDTSLKLPTLYQTIGEENYG